MNKAEFLSAVRDGLRGLGEADIERSLDFYREAIDDRIEDGMSEEEVIAAMDPPDIIARDILMEIPLPKLVKAKTTPRRRLQAWEILLIVVGSPLWLSLGAAAVSLLIAAYAVLWSAVVTVWAVTASLGGSGLGLLISGVLQLATAGSMTGLVYVGLSLALAGLGTAAGVGSVALTRLMVKVSLLIPRRIKTLIIGKEREA